MTFRDASPEDLAAVEALLGRTLAGRCAVVVRRNDGRPVVIENEPHLRDGTPMPTLYWLVDPQLHDAVSRLESEGGVHRFEGLVDAEHLQRSHDEYAARRARATVRTDGAQAVGGVGGTRVGVKCLHAHLANFLVGADDPVGALVAESVGLPALERIDVRDGPVAALDCGSNSTRLLIVDTTNTTLRREMRITRLSQGVDATGTLTGEALQRSYDVLALYRAMMDDAGVARGLLVATSAVRDANNGAAFLAEARRITGVEARILSGTEEATLSYAGATAGLEPDPRPTLIVDVGGGSTELAVEVDGVLHSHSMQLGCVRVTERALGREIVDAAHDAAARAMIADGLDQAWRAEPVFADLLGRVRMVGLAGSVSTLAQLDAGLAVYDRDAVHLRRLSRDSVQAWRDRLSAESPSARLARPGMVPGREDVLHAGLYVLCAVMARLGVEELLSSENDILDGITASILSSDGPAHDLPR